VTLRIRTEPDAVIFDVKVTPRASKARVGPLHGECLKVAVTAPPVGGAANAAVCALLADALGVPQRNVEIVRGDTASIKTVRVRGAREEDVLALAASK